MIRRDDVHRRALAAVRGLGLPNGVAARVVPLVVARVADGWHVFLAKAFGAGPDLVAVGSTGVFALKFAERAPDPALVDGVTGHVDRWSGRLRAGAGSAQVLASSAVHEAVVVPAGTRVARDSGTRIAVVPEDRFRVWSERQATRLSKGQRDSVAHQLSALLDGYRSVSVDAPSAPVAAEGLLEAGDLRAEHLESAQERPFERWTTFLHPDQQQLVTRKYSGPARISGPAGTGKTVVALHRLRHLARRTTGQLMFTTFVRTLPPFQRAAFQRLAAEFDHRVDFVGLHSWAGRFLARRGVHLEIDQSQALTLFNRAWTAHRGPLERIEPNPDYWRTEVDRVIKGRGLRTFEEYRAVHRPGRTVPLNPRQKQHVWELFEAYQGNLAAKGLHDYNDMVDAALREATEDPLPEPYAAVVVDEVQDITLTGLRLLRALVGDGPDGLLLVGDGQQQVYTGGWRLSEAGIPIHGRGAVLRTNYRNRAEVLAFAQGFDARNAVDDLDGVAGVGLRDVEAVNPGGTVRTWEGPREALGPALVAAVEGMPTARGASAVIAFTQRDATACAAALRGAGVPFVSLEDYTGAADAPIKLGTVHRAKGLDFQGVLVVHAPPGAASTAGDAEQERLNGRQALVAATRARDFLWWGTVR